MDLKFRKSDQGYTAEGDGLRYTVKRTGRTWVLRISRLVDVGTLDPIKVAANGPAEYEDVHDTKKLCVRVAGEYEALGNGYRSSDHGHRERATEAVLRAYTEKPGTDSEEEPMPKTNRAATRHVRRNMDRETRPMHHAWESFSLESLTLFTADAKRWLSDNTELASRTIDSADYETIYTELSNYDNTESDDTMATKMPKADVNTDAGAEAIATIDGLIEDVAKASSKGATDVAVELEREAEERISALSGKGVAGVKATKRKALREAASTPVAAPEVSGYEQFEGVGDHMDAAKDTARKAVEAGKKVGALALDVSRSLLEIRLRIAHPKTGLPDLSADSKFTKNAAADMYAAVREEIDPEDQDRLDAFESLKRSVQERTIGTTVEWLRALDGFADDSDSQTARVELLGQYFPDVADAVAADPTVSATEAVYDLYASKGMELPRKSLAEIARDRRAAAKARTLRAELEAAQDSGEDERAEEIVAQLRPLEEAVPAELLAPAPERTPQEKAFARIDKTQEGLTKLLNRKPKTPDERNDLAARLEALSGWVAAQAAELRKP